MTPPEIYGYRYSYELPDVWKILRAKLRLLIWRLRGRSYALAKFYPKPIGEESTFCHIFQNQIGQKNSGAVGFDA
jgi:hypothetical protein